MTLGLAATKGRVTSCDCLFHTGLRLGRERGWWRGGGVGGAVGEAPGGAEAKGLRQNLAAKVTLID